ncbi:vWA domain-containing protein [Pseudoduganella chitinolytica]|uniref:VWA domain-containing protein n=1 Tax=Pseudoduganella chitinolytica TaxID=34070 RepID=A0ABY8BB63_9BURK|nr:vWA domain-containing protein [Pseudoduganella chitinolytica]WEF32002.1 VWA domain-containing protein [Pseudoduganella chitinolytica]
MMPTSLHRQRGAVAIMVAVALLLLLSVVGLVLDGGLAYMVKARLNAAVDSAALAGARAVTSGNTPEQQIASANEAIEQFFAANIADNYLLSKPHITSKTVQFNNGEVVVDVHAEAPMSVSLMGVLGFTELMPAAHAQTIRRDLDMAFVVDTSGSLYGSRAAVRTAAKSFLNRFNVSQDRVGLMHFAYGAEIDKPIRTSARGFERTSMFSKIDGYSFTGSTAAVEGMWHARDQLNGIPEKNRSVLRVIVFFSDGVPNSLGAYLPFKGTNHPCNYVAGVFDSSGNGLYSLTDSEGTELPGCQVLDAQGNILVKNLPDGYNAHNAWNVAHDPSKHEFQIVTSKPRAVTSTISTQNISRAARNLPEAIAARAREEGIFVFTLGLGNDLKKTYDGEIGENVLKCMANVADGPARCYNPAKPVGMYCYAATEADLTPCFSRLASAILRISK